MEFEGMTLGEIGDEALVFVGIGSSELVIDVRDGEDEPDFGSELEEKVEQRDGIGASRDGCGDAISGANEAMTVNGFKQLFGERVHGEMVNQSKLSVLGS